MLIGIPREIKNHEYRVGMTPASVREVVLHGHQVLVEMGAGAGIGCDDASYLAAGASIAETAAEIFSRAEMIVKVKEPQPVESSNCAPASCCSPTCTWPRTRSRPRG